MEKAILIMWVVIVAIAWLIVSLLVMKKVFKGHSLSSQKLQKKKKKPKRT